MAAFEEKKSKKRKGISGIISFILLLISGGVIFYFGWVQFELPEHTYAVLFSKTSGYDEKILEPGKFNWKWERLLPTNSKLIKLQIENRAVTLDYKGSLPSSELFSSIIPQNPDFSYKINFSITYNIKHENIPELLKNGSIDTDDLISFYNTIESEYIRIIKDSCMAYFNEYSIITSKAYIELENITLERLKQKYFYINIRTLTINYLHFPDLQLYDKTRDLYYQILDNRKEAEIASEKWAIESKVNLDTKLEILSKYGELLSKYPILIDYFSLDPESQVLDISNLKDYKYETSEE